MTTDIVKVVGGYDLSSVASGITFVRGTWDGESVKFESLIEKAYRVENNFPAHYACAHKMLQVSCSVRVEYGLDLCAFEDYTMQIASMVSFSMGEVGGVTRAFHFASGFPILLNKPNVMRSFAADMRKIPKGALGKRALIEWAGEDFNYESVQTYVKERSDCTDAYWHAVIGIYTLFFLEGIPLGILSSKRQMTWKNPKGSGILDNLSTRLLYPKMRSMNG
jgi:hypothetical protein